MSSETLAVIDHVVRTYGNRRAVDDLCFALHRGEVVGLLGPNGAGKSSTMNMICGCLAPTAGRIVVGGHDLAEEPRKARRNIGYLPEIPPLYPDLTVLQYLEFCGGLRRMGRNARIAAVRRATDRCGLADVATRRIGNLSRGYQQRIGIAQAIMHEPALVILDEPTVGLDPAQVVVIRSLVRELGRSQGVLVSTHILQEVRNLCDRVIIIGAGRLLLDAPLSDVDADGRLESTFLRLTGAAKEPSE